MILSFIEQQDVAAKIISASPRFAGVQVHHIPSSTGKTTRLPDATKNGKDLDIAITLLPASSGEGYVVWATDNHGVEVSIPVGRDEAHPMAVPSAYRCESPADVEARWQRSLPYTGGVSFYWQEKGFDLDDINSVLEKTSFLCFKILLPEQGKRYYNAGAAYTSGGKIVCIDVPWLKKGEEGKWETQRSTIGKISGDAALVLNDKLGQAPDVGCVFVCEGCATALSLALVTRFPVYGCGSIKRMKIVAQRALKEHPDKNIVCCLDCDPPAALSKHLNELHKELPDVLFCFPSDERMDGFDFNDLMQEAKRTYKNKRDAFSFVLNLIEEQL